MKTYYLLMKTYYLLMKHGVPVDVCTMLNDALLRQKEWTTPGAPAEILAVAPIQLELDFDDEPTKPDTIPDPDEYCAHMARGLAGSCNRCAGT